MWPNLFWYRMSITCSISTQPCHSPWWFMPHIYAMYWNFSRYTYACSVCSGYYFGLNWNLEYTATCCTCLFCQQIWAWLPQPFITPIVAITSVLAAVNKYLLFSEVLGSNKLILEKYYAHTTFHHCYNSDPQSKFTQQPRANFSELQAH